MALSCSYTNFRDVVQSVHEHNLNATAYVAKCDDACSVMFGSGNPDISGIGLMISYVIQAIVACIFGPVFPIFVCLVGDHPSPLIKSVQEIFHAARASMYKIHLFFSNTLVLAAIVQFRMVPSILETYFITDLLNLQFLISMCLLQAHTTGSEALDKDSVNIAWVGLVGSTAVQFLAANVISMPDAALTVSYEVALACHNLRGTNDISGRFKDREILPTLKIILPSMIGTIVMMVLVILLVQFLEEVEDLQGTVSDTVSNHTPEPVQRRWQRLSVWSAKVTAWIRRNTLHRLFSTYTRRNIRQVIRNQKARLSTWWHGLIARVRQTSLRSITVGTLFMWMFSLALTTYSLLKSRSTLKQMSGAQFQDNKWGWGQTTSVVLWLPLVKTLLTESWKAHKTLKNPRVLQKMETSQYEQDRLQQSKITEFLQDHLQSSVVTTGSSAMEGLSSPQSTSHERQSAQEVSRESSDEPASKVNRSETVKEPSRSWTC